MHLGNAHTGNAPFHWDGQFPDMPSLTRATVTDLMAGDALLVDVSTVLRPRRGGARSAAAAATG